MNKLQEYYQMHKETAIIKHLDKCEMGYKGKIKPSEAMACDCYGYICFRAGWSSRKSEQFHQMYSTPMR